jgi:hypothetical protein
MESAAVASAAVENVTMGIAAIEPRWRLSACVASVLNGYVAACGGLQIGNKTVMGENSAV